MPPAAPAREPQPLPAGEVHVHWLCPSDCDDALLAAYEPLLSPDERERRDRYVFPEGRREQLLARALLRTTLSRYAPVPPTAWRFGKNAHGRPHIVGPSYPGLRLRFNLTHTHGLVALAVLRADGARPGEAPQPHDRPPLCAVGLDAEDLEHRRRMLEVADRFFAPPEVAALRALPAEPPTLQRDRFFDYWTLKEAYIKARGLGLAIPLDQFWFTLPPPRLSCAPTLGDDGARWFFAQHRPTPRHLLSLAVGATEPWRPGSPGPLIRWRHTVPLQGSAISSP